MRRMVSPCFNGAFCFPGRITILGQVPERFDTAGKIIDAAAFRFDGSQLLRSQVSIGSEIAAESGNAGQVGSDFLSCWFDGIDDVPGGGKLSHQFRSYGKRRSLAVVDEEVAHEIVGAAGQGRRLTLGGATGYQIVVEGEQQVAAKAIDAVEIVVSLQNEICGLKGGGRHLGTSSFVSGWYVGQGRHAVPLPADYRQGQ